MLKNIPDYPKEEITGFILSVFRIGDYYGGLFSFGEHKETEEDKNELQVWNKYIVHVINKTNTTKTGRVSLRKLFSPYEHYDVTFEEDKRIYLENLDDYEEEEELFYKTDKLYEAVLEVKESDFFKKAIEIIKEKYGIDRDPEILWIRDEEICEFYPKGLEEMEINNIAPENLTRIVNHFYMDAKCFE